MSESNTVMATLITDASFSPTTGEAAWAGRVICRKTRATYTGGRILPGGSSNDAELLAIVDTLIQSFQATVIEPGMGLLLQTDNLHVVRLLNHHFEKQSHRNWPPFPPRTTPHQEKAMADVKRLFEALKPDWVFSRHVKGHVSKNQRAARQHVQESMDILAKETRRRLRMGG